VWPGIVGATINAFVPKSPAYTSGWLDDWCLGRIAAAIPGAALRLELWDGRSLPSACPRPVATIRVADRATLVRLLLRPTLEFGEAYSAGRVQVQGNLVAALEAVNRAFALRPPRRWNVRAGSLSRASARENVHEHYDLGNAFYRLWLDEAMVYTCAYFEHPEATLEEAQRAKLDYVCRKLQLRPGDRVVEAGCGWGALALHMARHYGVTVRAYNVSRPQLEFARARATREGLEARVTFIDVDYRAITERADVFVSVGMLEHVGRARYAELGAVIDRVLDPAHGRGLLHFIGRNTPTELTPWITRHIFPGAYAPTLGEMLPGTLEAANLAVLDVENLRLHYALTLRHWLDRFEAHADRIRTMFDEPFVRTWRLYLASSQACFTTGDLQLFQVTFSRAADNTRPWTRDGLYVRQSVSTDDLEALRGGGGSADEPV
jgi:cyclopropane-fatty-acyl-phospholipid synthase